MRALRPAGGELARAVSVGFVGFAGEVEVEEMVSRPWASITFTGARHELCVRLQGPGAADASARFLAELSEAEFDLRGHIVADIALLAEERPDEGDLVRLRLEALTVEDC